LREYRDRDQQHVEKRNKKSRRIQFHKEQLPGSLICATSAFRRGAELRWHQISSILNRQFLELTDPVVATDQRKRRERDK
jgi:hypothetical protein